MNKKRYQEYCQRLIELYEAGVLKVYPKFPSHQEWEKEDYRDRVESYLIREYETGLLAEECFHDSLNDEQQEAVYYTVVEYIDSCYQKKQPVTMPAKWLSSFFKRVKNEYNREVKET
jgi:hypothetical protein